MFFVSLTFFFKEIFVFAHKGKSFGTEIFPKYEMTKAEANMVFLKLSALSARKVGIFKQQ